MTKNNCDLSGVDDDFIKKPLDHIKTDIPKISAPAQRALYSLGITTLIELSKFKESEIAKLHGMGLNALTKLSTALENANLTYGNAE